jgi:DNA-binding MarR family transcriptional regulator
MTDPEGCAGEPGSQEEELLRLLFRATARQQLHLARAVAPLDVTESQALLIRELPEPLPMRLAAERMHCDASNLTGMVDRLEGRGLIERRADPADRRVRLLALTPRGHEVREALGDLPRTAPGIQGLSDAERGQLAALLRRLAEA